MKMRNINIQSGNYNENISGDYVQGKTVVTETIVKDGKTITTKTTTTIAADGTKTTITEGSSEPIHKVQSVSQSINASGAGSFNLGNIFGTVANTINNIQQAATTKSMIIGENTTGVNQGRTIIGNSNTQIVQGNGNQVVQQSMFNNIQTGGDISIGDVVQQSSLNQTALDKARDFNENIEEYLDNLEVSNDTEQEIEDFWLSEEEQELDPRLSVFFEVFNDQLEHVIDDPTPRRYIVAMMEMVEYFELAPAIMQYVLDNQDVVVTRLKEREDSEIAIKLFSKLVESYNI